jgi:hypothetical protein
MQYNYRAYSMSCESGCVDGWTKYEKAPEIEIESCLTVEKAASEPCDICKSIIKLVPTETEDWAIRVLNQHNNNK